MLSHTDTNSPQVELEEVLSDDSYDQWVTYYGMREKVACPSNLREDLKAAGVRLRLGIGDQLLLTREIHRRRNIYSMLMWVLCT